MLWIGIHLPGLSLESFARTLPPAQAGQPLALVQAHRIAAANGLAEALGVVPGLKRATALALVPGLVLGQADACRDEQALLSVGHAALAFTPAVSLSPPAGVLLEVQASLRYFGGREALMARLRDALAPLGHALQCVSTPTAQGSALLSRWQGGLHCADATALRQALAQMPVELLAAGEAHAATFEGMGLQTVADVLRLPRAGLTRRFGSGLLEELDAALGERPDPRDALMLPPVFHSRLALFARADTTQQVLHGAQVLLARLVVWLSAQHAHVCRFHLEMKHEPRWRGGVVPAVSVLEVALAEPSRDAAHMSVLLRERLGALQLPAPTLELALHADDIAHQPPPTGELFPLPHTEQAGFTRLIERLQARLGREQVQCLVPVADHRPEHATQVCPAEAGPRRASAACLPGAPPIRLTRPAWLLPEPVPLQERHARPLLDGQVLHVLAGPERIESGWWDNHLVTRDYFIAQTPQGALVWLYRGRFSGDAGAPAWFLHGRFA